jgi:hypothetical protein
MPSRHAVLPTLSGDSNCPLWSYLHTGTLPRLISFVSHSYENTGGVRVFFPFWNSLAGCRGFDPGNERLSKSSADYCRLITDHCPLTCPDPVGATATLALSPLDATLMDLPASVANKGLTSWLNPLDATLTKNRGGYIYPRRRSDFSTFKCAVCIPNGVTGRADNMFSSHQLAATWGYCHPRRRSVIIRKKLRTNNL